MRHVVKATALAISLLQPFAADAQDEKWLCKHTQGDRIFKGSMEVLVTRSASAVTVTGAPGSGLSSIDVWTYRLMFETPGVGFRAIRAALPEGGSTRLDAILGGELFLTEDERKLRLFVTGINAASADISFAVLLCRSAA